MILLLIAAMAMLLLRPATAMAAISASCHLFVTAVLPGLLPYMVLSAMLVSRCGRSKRPVSAGLLVLLGWCGGSPSGARLMAMQPHLSARQRMSIAVATAAMSPMFLVGTCGMWLGSPKAGWVLLLSVLAGGGVAGLLAGRLTHSEPIPITPAAPPLILSFGAAVEQAARTLLMVCGTMAMGRMFAVLAAQMCPALALPLTTLLEVTAGIQGLAALPLPLSWRTALIAGAAGFGGMAIVLQNRAVQPSPPPLMVQLGWQALHGGLSFLLAMGGAWLIC